MNRLCLRSIAGSAIALICYGCTGQNIEGTWNGPLPFEDAKACRIKIYSDHRFDVSCGNLDWAGAGRYERVGDLLTLKFAAWVHKGQVLRDLPRLELSFTGEGNKMRLGDPRADSKPLIWERAKL